ncbi:MAG: M28 family peptidase [Flavobacteriales bacterium]|nr:M28 family peptidase [Flavobacteriales bacterium]
MKTKLIYFTILLLLFACENDHEKKKKTKTEPNVVHTPEIERPEFNKDSAYTYIQQQVDFGPRFPNNEAHGKCASFLQKKLASFGWIANIQEGKSRTFNNKTITIKNIIGEYKPEKTKRVLLFAHWDSRPFADQDNKDMTQPILGANDGASGVGILLEVARQISIHKPEIGVDIIFFDAEDYGQPSSGMVIENNSETWCLGSQYWARNRHKPDYKADYGILLDMVGSANAYFTHESISRNYAPQILQKVWSNAKQLGYGNYFVSKETYFVGVDDHKFVNEIAGIPSIDIIHHDRFTGNFHPSWHTHNDNMDVIDKSTIGAVGETLLFTLYSEQ